MSLKEVAQTAVGSVEKAYLVLSKYSTKTEKDLLDRQAALKRPKEMIYQKDFGELTGRMVEIIPTPLTAEEMKPTKLYYQVQFNPSSLSLRTQGSHEQVNNADPTKVKVSEESTKTPPLILSFTLYFDDMVSGDCFMGDTINAGLSTQNIMDATKKGTHSVMAEMNGLLAVLKNPTCRRVNFYWAKFHFEGLLDSVTAKYTMFSTTGRPVRGEAAIRLSLDYSGTALEPWKTSYETSFGGTGVKSVSATGSSLGSFINLG